MEKMQFYLTKNPFDSSSEAGSAERFVAKVKKQGIIYQDDLVQEMLKKNTSLSRHDINAVLSLLKESVQDQIQKGYFVHTDLFRAGFSIKGDFQSGWEKFDPQKHRVCVTMKAALDFQKELERNAEVKLVEYSGKKPFINRLYRFEDDALSDRFSPGDLIEVRGRFFKADKMDTEVLLCSDDVSVSLRIHRLFDRAVLCSIPDNIAAGDYQLYVVVSNQSDRLPGKYPTLVEVITENTHFQD